MPDPYSRADQWHDEPDHTSNVSGAQSYSLWDLSLYALRPDPSEAARAKAGRCPDCGVESASRKGGYVRRLQDLPVHDAAVRLEVRVTRWRCRNCLCERQSFTGSIAATALAYARRTRRVSELARLVGVAAGGRPAERLLGRLGLRQSDDTILRTLKRHAAQRQRQPLRVAGIDDWSWRKGVSAYT